MHAYVVICPNGEPNFRLWRFIGPFEGREHARLWLEHVHCIESNRAPDPNDDANVCRNGGALVAEHMVEGLERPGARSRAIP